jgi:hypothetical protein
MSFYMRVKPWGFWKPVLRKVRERYPNFQPNMNFKRDAFNVIVGIVWQTSLVALPIYTVIQETVPMLVTAALLLITSTVLKFSWWNKLDEASRVEVEYERPEAALAAEPELGLSKGT